MKYHIIGLNQSTINTYKFLKKINSNRRTENSGLAYLINPIEEI